MLFHASSRQRPTNVLDFSPSDCLKQQNSFDKQRPTIAMRQVILPDEELARLRAELKQSKSSSVYRRATALLAANRGSTISSIASLLGVTRQTVYNWMAAYSGDKRSTNLNDAPRSGRPSLLTEEIDALMVAALASSPETFGYSSSRWSAAILRAHISSQMPHDVSDETLRRRLRRIGYAWKDGRYVRRPEPATTASVPSCHEARQA